MKDLAKQFLSEDERARVSAAVEEAEKRTFGEIVVMIISASYHYPMANVTGGGLCACPRVAIDPFNRGMAVDRQSEYVAVFRSFHRFLYFFS